MRNRQFRLADVARHKRVMSLVGLDDCNNAKTCQWLIETTSDVAIEATGIINVHVMTAAVYSRDYYHTLIKTSFIHS